MNVVHTMLYEPSFNIQADVHLEQKVISYSDGPERAYLIHPYQCSRGMEYTETVGLWVLDADGSEALAAVLGTPAPESSEARPWYVNWIKQGQLVAHKQWIGVDQGAHLLLTMQGCDILDRRTHLFGKA